MADADDRVERSLYNRAIGYSYDAVKIFCDLESAGVEFIDENGGGPGVRLRKRQQKTGSRRE